LSRHGNVGPLSRSADFLEREFTAKVLESYRKDPEWSHRHALRAQYTKDDKGLYWTAQHQLVIPNDPDLQDELIHQVHAPPWAGHYGVKRTLRAAQELYYWPNMEQAVSQYVSSCDSCQRVQYSRQKPAGKLKPLPVPDRRWESVSLDLVTDLPPTSRGHDAVVVFVDRLSKMVHIAPCTKTASAERCAELFEREVFRLHGVPQTVISDRDVRFNSEFWKSVFQRLGVKLNMSTTLHPQTDGQTENANRVFEDTIRHFVGPYQNDWDNYLAVVEFAMNRAWNQTIETTPFMLNYGQQPDTPQVLRLRSSNPRVAPFVGKWDEQLVRAKRCIQSAQDRQKRYADQKRSETPVFQPGDEVLVKTRHFALAEGLRPKLAPRYMGPYTVREAVGGASRNSPGVPVLANKLNLPPAMSKVHPVFHVSALKRYKRTARSPALSQNPKLVDRHFEYEVDYISASRYSGRRTEYKVFFVGEPDHPDWLHWSTLANAPEKVQEFSAHKQQPCPHDFPKRLALVAKLPPVLPQGPPSRRAFGGGSDVTSSQFLFLLRYG